MSSLVWNYFKIKVSDNSEAECLLCATGNTLLSRLNPKKGSKYYSTKPLLDHLEKKHKTTHLKIKEISESSREKVAEKRKHDIADTADDDPCPSNHQLLPLLKKDLFSLHCL